LPEWNVLGGFMTDRITPLPWKLVGEGPWIDGGSNQQDIWPVARVSLLEPASSYPDAEDRMRANAAYIVHACNALPKLEALNAELLKKTEYALFMVQQYSKEHPLFNEMVAELEDLIKRAKGMVSNG
jgi:hypothetical protein